LKLKERAADGPAGHDSGLGGLYEAIERLPEKYRQVLELAVHGMPVADIARELAIETGTVKSRALRGREMLYRLMKEEV